MSITASDNFDWHSDEEVIIREQQSIAVYRNAHRALVIRQERAWDDDSDVYIVIQPEYARRLIDAIHEAIADDPEQLALPAPSVSAEKEHSRRGAKKSGGGK